MHPHLSRRALLRATVALLAIAALPCVARAQARSERELRAAYLFNFLRFTEWPEAAFAGPAAPIQMCVLGSADPFDNALAAFDGRAIGERTLRVRQGLAPAAAADCHLVYVADADAARLTTLRQTAAALPMLIVGESEALLDRGATIAFRPSERRLGFVVNLAAARRQELKLSSQLLRLAAEVRE